MPDKTRGVIPSPFGPRRDSRGNSRESPRRPGRIYPTRTSGTGTEGRGPRRGRDRGARGRERGRRREKGRRREGKKKSRRRVYLRVACGEKFPELANARCDSRNRATHIRNPRFSRGRKHTDGGIGLVGATRHELADGLRLYTGEGVSRSRCEREGKGGRKGESGRTSEEEVGAKAPGRRKRENEREGECFLNHLVARIDDVTPPDSPRGSFALSLPPSLSFSRYA